MTAPPAFVLFESRLRDDHREEQRAERTRLEGEAPPMPEPKLCGYRHGRSIVPPIGSHKTVTTMIPAADFIAMQELAEGDGLALSAYLRELVRQDVVAKRGAAAAGDFLMSTPPQPIPFPVAMLTRPPAPGWWWWRSDSGNVWLALEVKEDPTKPGELYVAHEEDPDIYQGDGEPPERSWDGEWHPVPIQPPA